LWRIALVRMHCHPPTRAYVERRTSQGLSKLDIMRRLQRYIAREIYHHLWGVIGHASSDRASRYSPPLLVTRTGVAVAQRRLGPSSSATTSTTDRAMPASAVHASLEPAQDHSAASAHDESHLMGTA
jgi:hypothetical protein